MTEHIDIPIQGQSSVRTYKNIENGPQGSGLYEIDVHLRKLTTNEVLERLKEKLRVPSLASETPSEATRVLGCAEVGPHGAHQIWMENDEYATWFYGSDHGTRTPPSPRFFVSMCEGSND